MRELDERGQKSTAVQIVYNIAHYCTVLWECMMMVKVLGNEVVHVMNLQYKIALP